MKINKLQLFLLGLIATPAYALPIPEFTSAVFGIGEIFLLLIAGLSLYFPFLKKSNNSGKFVYPLLVISIVLNIYYFAFAAPDNVESSVAREDRPGMIWSQEDRNKDPNSISEQDAYKILLQQEANGSNEYIFVDARSKSETELGTAKGFIKMRWPDLASEHLEALRGRTVIATCWTGMRGSEVCDKLRSLGINCKYLRGGLSEWVLQKLPLILSENVLLENFGTAEVFPNSSKVLSIRETVTLVKSGAKIIDMRTPEQFQKNSISNSININFNDLTTPEIEYRISSLRSDKLIVACYGLTSCSEAALLGWEMNRLGYQYMGSYSGGVIAFNESYYKKNEVSTYNGIRNSFINLFNYLGQKNELSFLVLMSCFILGVCLFFTKKMSFSYFKDFNDRKKRTILLRAKFPNDPWVLKRETQLHYKKDLVNIFKSFVILFLALLCSFFIDVIYSTWGRETFFSVSNWQDKIGISPLSILAATFISFSLNFLIFKNKLSKGLFFGLIGIFIISLIILKDISKINVLILIITFVVMYFIEIILKSKKLYKHFNRSYANGFLDLQDAYEKIPKGTKAYNLSLLMSKGFKVPPGIVVRSLFIDKLSLKTQKNILKKLGPSFTARSSALNEDMQNSSRAGLNLSIVPSSIKTWLGDLKKVFISYKSKKADEIILMQKYIEPTFAGVIFSKHPQWGGVVLIEWGMGFAGARMDGSENAEQIVLERASGRVVYESKHNEVMLKCAQDIYQLLLKVEQLYDYALDIEWAIDSEGLWLLQARPQNAIGYASSIDADKEFILTPQFKPLKTSELSMSMIGCTRLSASLVCNLWGVGGSADHASRLALWKWNSSYTQQNAYVYIFGRIWNSDYALLNKPNWISWLISKRTFNSHLTDIRIEANKLLADNKINLAIDWSLLSKDSWIELWSNTLNNWYRIQTFAFYFEFMAQIAIEDVLKSVGNSEDYLSSGIDSFYSKDVSFRSDNDYEISTPRYLELEKNLDVKSLLFGKRDKKAKDISHLESGIQEKIKYARELIYLREEYKHYSLNFFYLLRVAVLDVQKRFNLQEEVFDITFKEIPQLFIQNET